MKEQFKNAMVICAAVATFSGSTVIVANLGAQLIDSRVQSVLASSQAAAESSESDSAKVKAGVIGLTGKLLQLLK